MRWYTINARVLPWRKTRDPYKIWISEVMLQQTTVAAVIPYYDRWIKFFPDIPSVAAAPLQKILKIWQGLGYYSRARNVHKAAKIMQKTWGGRIPDDPMALRSLPGFGPYTTGAVLSIAFHKRHPIIDANVRRVVVRHEKILAQESGKINREIYNFLEEVIPDQGIGIFNQALMELGALVCRSRSPQCLLCPVRESCRAHHDNLQEMIPRPRIKTVKRIRVAVAVIQRGRKYFIQQRPPAGLFADLWEFPGGKIENGETAQEAVRREVQEELGVAIVPRRLLMKVRHNYTHFSADLFAWICELSGEILQTKKRRWVTMTQLIKYPMPSGTARIVEKIQKGEG